MSQRRACATLDVNRSTCQYRSCRPGQAPLEARIKEICETRVRYGYRRVHVHLRREGWDAEIHTSTELRATAEEFIMDSSVEARANGETVTQRAWQHTIPRTSA